MGLGIASCSISLLLLLSLSIHGDGAREMDSRETNVLRLHNMDQGLNHHHQHGPGNLDQSSSVFFTMKDLKKGKVLPIYFPKRNTSNSPKFLAREEAESIPFASKDLPYLLKFFSFSQGSPQAKAIENTLHVCEMDPIKGETKLCPTSLESMLDFVRDMFSEGDGSETPQFKALSTVHLTESNTLFQNYTVLEAPQEVAAPKIVACHTLPYPYLVLYCHSQKTKNKVFEVPLEGANGDKVKAVAICHLDTSQWRSDHVSFQILGIKPGTSHVCHFFPADNLVWVPIPAVMQF